MVTNREPNDTALEREIGELLTNCRGPLLNYAAGVARSADEAHDALQEASLRYWLERREGATFDNPRAWLFRVARHYLVDQMRKQSRESGAGSEDLTRIADPAANPAQAYEQTVLSDAINRVLSPRERACIRHRLNGMSYEEIARQMCISPNTVGVLINRAFKKVRPA